MLEQFPLLGRELFETSAGVIHFDSAGGCSVVDVSVGARRHNEGLGGSVSPFEFSREEIGERLDVNVGILPLAQEVLDDVVGG